MQRATAAMKNAHDANTLKTAAAILLTEADTVKELSKKLDQLGKPNSASKKSVKPHLDEIRSSESEFAEASKQFAKTVSTTRLSEEDRLAYAFAGMSFGQALERFGFNEKDFE
jgi:hypothetical protein